MKNGSGKHCSSPRGSLNTSSSYFEFEPNRSSEESNVYICEQHTATYICNFYDSHLNISVFPNTPKWLCVALEKGIIQCILKTKFVLLCLKVNLHGALAALSVMAQLTASGVGGHIFIACPLVVLGGGVVLHGGLFHLAFLSLLCPVVARGRDGLSVGQPSSVRPSGACCLANLALLCLAQHLTLCGACRSLSLRARSTIRRCRMLS